MRSWVMVLALVACGSKPPPRPDHVDEHVEPPADPACKASYAASTGSCAGQVACTFPAGTCVCSGPPRCGGANVSAAEEGPLSWYCEPKPPEVRADGCPGEEPRGRACTAEGKQCTYESCCMSQLTCHGGTWQETRHECPP